MSNARYIAIPLILGTIAGTSGCSSQAIAFLSSQCEVLREGNRLKALVFVSAFEATNLQGKQLVYQVRLFDRNRAPLVSCDRRFQVVDGTVAATTTMLVFTSRQTFKDVRVSIPAGELGVPPNSLPAFANIAVFEAGGRRLAEIRQPLPPLTVEEIMPPLTPRPVPYWFVKVKDPNRLPILLGAFATLAEAEAAVTDETESPKEIRSDEYLWFVPFHNRNVKQNVVLVGPCDCEKEARDVAGLLAGMPDLSRKGLVAGSPVEVQVQQWLKEREVRQILASLPAETMTNDPAKPP